MIGYILINHKQSWPRLAYKPLFSFMMWGYILIWWPLKTHFFCNSPISVTLHFSPSFLDLIAPLTFGGLFV